MTRAALVLILLALLPGSSAAAAEPFPTSFQWGVATSGFQTEAGGAPDNADHRSDWWEWTHDGENLREERVTRDKVERGPGHWRVWRRDLDLADGLGSDVFRLGVEWSRIFPRSTEGATTMRALDRLGNKRALRHYRRVLRGVRRRGMKPFVTLSHFSLPIWIHDPIAAREQLGRVGADDDVPTLTEPGGWLDSATVREFSKYARYLGHRLGDLVDVWTPINEPVVVAANGYINVPGVLDGNFPPGALSFAGAVESLQTMVAANARAYEELKRADPGSKVGLVQNLIAFTPTDPTSPADVASARNANQLYNRLFIDAAVRGIIDNDADGTVDPGEDRSPSLAGKADFIGVNYYFRGRVTALGQPLTQRIPLLDFAYKVFYDGSSCPTTCTEFGTEVYPEGFRDVLAIAGSYGLPVYITENGLADADDDQRRDYVLSHLEVLRQAMADGVADVRGYLYWSLVDNFEWSSGYAPHFGLYSFDPRTLRRTARPSAALIRRIFRTGELP